MSLLWEAREHAIDGGSSEEKHAWFGKYKGRIINNYLRRRLRCERGRASMERETEGEVA